MKKYIITFLLIVGCTLNAYGNQESQEVQEVTEVAEENALVYLSVEDAVASSFDDTPDWAPPPNSKAPIDGDILTRWSSQLGVDNEWIYFDLGKPKVLSKIIIRWETAYALDYEILASLDNKNWKRLVLMEGQDGVIDEIEFSPIKARYVKMIGLKRNNSTWGVSIWEFEIYGPKSLNPDEPERKTPVVDLTKKKEELAAAIAELKEEPTPMTLEEFHKGVVYTSWTDWELGSVPSDLMLVHLKKIGVKHVAIMAPTYQDAVDSTEIVVHDFEGGDSPTDRAIAHAIQTCHALGIKVLLKPHVDCKDGTFRGDIIGTKAWFANYKKIALRYAKLAQDNNVEIFSVGTELENTSFDAWDAEWRDIIASVRAIYTGYITYSANWTEYIDMPFWDALDLIGIDAYFPLTNKNDPTKEELVAAWEKHADILEKWLKDNDLNKPIIFTELGYVSSDGTNKQPWATLSNPEDQKEQADCLDAALEVLSKRSWFKGMYIWQYFPLERWSPIGFPIRDKEAEVVIEKWYKEIE
ncbi:MAG: discoidin domain-containing protein [Candidatus Omnitrophica bacterium]|nr:discoidin domain-containing protein [Candidatus Omnitrophota bacterium]